MMFGSVIREPLHMTGMTIEMLPTEPILLVTYHKEFSFKTEARPALANISATLDSVAAPVYYIVDMTDEPSIDFQDFLTFTSELTRSQNALLHHRNIKENIVVTNSKFFKAAAKGVSADVFGGVKIRTFDTLDEALAYARSA
jgi:hypothetical protein